MTRAPCAISVADHAGWSHLVCVAASNGVPATVERRRVRTIEAGLPTMPYHHESLGMPVDEANALIARVRRSIAACTSRALQDTIAELAPTYLVVAVAIREPTFPELPDTVAVVRQSYQLQCAADGMMYQIAWCQAARELALGVDLCRRGEECRRAAAELHADADAVELFVGQTGRPPGPPWTKEHRQAYAAGIAALACRDPNIRLP